MSEPRPLKELLPCQRGEVFEALKRHHLIGGDQASFDAAVKDMAKAYPKYNGSLESAISAVHKDFTVTRLIPKSQCGAAIG